MCPTYCTSVPVEQLPLEQTTTIGNTTDAISYGNTCQICNLLNFFTFNNSDHKVLPCSLRTCTYNVVSCDIMERSMIDWQVVGVQFCSDQSDLNLIGRREERHSKERAMRVEQNCTTGSLNLGRKGGKGPGDRTDWGQ